MNRGFKYYFRQGIKASGKTMVKNKNYIKYFLYGLAEIFGRMLILPGLIFDLANVRLAKLVRDEHQITISDTFKSGSKAKSLWTLFLVYIMMGILYVAGAAMILIATVIFAVIGAAIGYMFGQNVIAILAILFALPGIVVLIVYSIIAPFYISPATYVIDTHENDSMSVVLKKCFAAMRKTGKWITFSNYLIPALIKTAYIVVYAVLGGGFLALSFALGKIEVLSKVVYLVALIIILIGIAGYIFGAPIFSLTTKVANYGLYEDLVENPEDKRINGLYVKKFEKRYVPVKSLESSLTLLFDETEEENIMLEDELKKSKTEQHVEDTNNTVLEDNEDETEELDVDNNVEASTDEIPSVEEVKEEIKTEEVKEEVKTEEPAVAEEVLEEQTTSNEVVEEQEVLNNEEEKTEDEETSSVEKNTEEV